MLWQNQDLAQLLANVSNWQAPEIEPGVSGIQIDSRQVQSGDLFIPLSPPIADRDGHQFIDAALNAGAAVALSSQASHNRQVLPVTDTLKALETLASSARHRLSSEAQVIAITGSSGKTTLRTW